MATAWKKPHDAEIDRLYGLPLDRFTIARDEAAKRLRTEGDRDGAGAVKALRKPTAAAWAVNQLARGAGGRLEELLALGRELRDAQERLVAGGEADVRDLSARERVLVQDLTGQARALLREHDAPAGEGTLEDVAATLHAAALDEQAAAAVAQGRLTRERRAIGLGLTGAAPKGRGKAPARRPAPPSRRAQAAEARLQAARTAAQEAREAAEGARRAARAAESELRKAERRAEQAAERERKAAEALDRLRG